MKNSEHFEWHVSGTVARPQGYFDIFFLLIGITENDVLNYAAC